MMWYTSNTSFSTTGKDSSAIDWVTDTTSDWGATGYKASCRAYNKWNVESLGWGDSDPRIIERIPNKIPAGQREMEMPDGSKLLIDDDGNYRIDDQNAQVVYQANRIREWSPHLNASDMLAQFVEYAGRIGVKRADVMNLPIHLFVSWLIIEAAERDGDQVPEDIVPVEASADVKLAARPRCLRCGRFIPRLHYRHRFPFCEPTHGIQYLESQHKHEPQTSV